MTWESSGFIEDWSYVEINILYCILWWHAVANIMFSLHVVPMYFMFIVSVEFFLFLSFSYWIFFVWPNVLTVFLHNYYNIDITNSFLIFLVQHATKFWQKPHNLQIIWGYVSERLRPQAMGLYGAISQYIILIM